MKFLIVLLLALSVLSTFSTLQWMKAIETDSRPVVLMGVPTISEDQNSTIINMNLRNVSEKEIRLRLVRIKLNETQFESDQLTAKTISSGETLSVTAKFSYKLPIEYGKFYPFSVYLEGGKELNFSAKKL